MTSSTLPVHQTFLDGRAHLAFDGRRQAYRHIGQGSAVPLVLLHGLMDNSAGFAPLLAALDRYDLLRRRVILAPDWRGHGDSTDTPGEYWFPNYLADLEALLDALGLAGPVVLIGHSMGGQVASLYAGARPTRVAGLITLDSLNVPDADPDDTPARYRDWLDTRATGRAPKDDRRYDSMAAFIDRLARRYPELDAAALEFLAGIWLRPGEDGGRQQRIDPAHRRRMPYGFRAAEAAALWRAVRCPVLCVDGGRSPATRFVGADTLAARRACFDRMTHATIPGCGHMLHIQDAPAVADVVGPFIRHIDAEGAT